jgi:hypothetical protein
MRQQIDVFIYAILFIFKLLQEKALKNKALKNQSTE